jgi:hypothetical protein
MDGKLFEKHITKTEIEARIGHVLESPKDQGTLAMIVRRPKIGKREVISEGILDSGLGLLGDNWLTRGSSRTTDGKGHPEMQLNLMNIRFAELIAGDSSRVPLAGDQMYVDLDLGSANLPTGTILAIGTALIEITSIPHLGCKKFVERFGMDAMMFANSDFGRQHNLRGVNARVVIGGKIAVGNRVIKAPAA